VCSTNFEIEDGTFSYVDNAAGSLGILSCSLPYVLRGSAEYTCTTMGNWEGSGVCSKFLTITIPIRIYYNNNLVFLPQLFSILIISGIQEQLYFIVIFNLNND